MARRRKPRPQRQVAQVDAELSGPLDEVQKVARRGADGIDAKVAQQHHLPVGVAARHRHHRCADRLEAVVGTEAAGEQAVAKGVLHDVAPADAGRGKRAQHHRRPHLDVLGRVGHHDRLAGGAARGVQPHDLRHRAGKEAKGIGVAQIGFHRERQAPQISQRLDAGRRQAARVHALTEEGHMRVGTADDALQAAQLEVAQLGGGQVVRRTDRMKARAGVIPVLSQHTGCLL